MRTWCGLISPPLLDMPGRVIASRILDVGYVGCRAGSRISPTRRAAQRANQSLRPRGIPAISGRRIGGGQQGTTLFASPATKMKRHLHDREKRLACWAGHRGGVAWTEWWAFEGRDRRVSNEPGDDL
jgi:hypothetical protein